MVTEVVPEYYAHIGARPDPAGRMTRAGYLDARLGSSPAADQPMGDVTEVRLRLSRERADRFTAVLTALGYARTPHGLVGPGVTVAVEAGRPDGVLSVRMTHSGGAVEEKFGDSSVLTTGPGVAEWHFTPTELP
jgi:hypothetical protein